MLLRCLAPTLGPQVCLCFHGTEAVPLPAWVLAAGAANPDIYFTDRAGVRNTHCISLGVDEGEAAEAEAAAWREGAGEGLGLDEADGLKGGKESKGSGVARPQGPCSHEACRRCQSRLALSVGYRVTAGAVSSSLSCQQFYGVIAVPALDGRTALACYRDLMTSFRVELEPLLGSTIVDVCVGECGAGGGGNGAWRPCSQWWWWGGGGGRCRGRLACG